MYSVRRRAELFACVLANLHTYDIYVVKIFPQGPLIRLLDEAVLSLEDTAEALDALVSVSNRLKIAGVR